MIEEIRERIKYIQLKTQDIHKILNNIQKYAKYGIGNLEFLKYTQQRERG